MCAIAFSGPPFVRFLTVYTLSNNVNFISIYSTLSISKLNVMFFLYFANIISYTAGVYVFSKFGTPHPKKIRPPSPGKGKKAPPSPRLHPPQPQLDPRCRKIGLECKPIKQCERVDRLNFRCPQKMVCCAEVYF